MVTVRLLTFSGVAAKSRREVRGGFRYNSESIQTAHNLKNDSLLSFPLFEISRSSGPALDEDQIEEVIGSFLLMTSRRLKTFVVSRNGGLKFLSRRHVNAVGSACAPGTGWHPTSEAEPRWRLAEPATAPSRPACSTGAEASLRTPSCHAFCCISYSC